MRISSRDSTRLGGCWGFCLRKVLRSPTQTALEQSPRRRTRALKIFSSHLTVKVVSGTRLIEIRFLSSDPKLAAEVVNELMKGLVEYTFQTRFTATNEASIWLTGQLSDLKKQAETLQGRVIALQRQSGVVSLGVQDAQGRDQAYSVVVDRLQQATATLSQATSNRISERRGRQDRPVGRRGAYLRVERERHRERVADDDHVAGTDSNSAPAGGGAAGADRPGRGEVWHRHIRGLGEAQANLAGIDRALHAEVRRVAERSRNDYAVARRAEEESRREFARGEARGRPAQRQGDRVCDRAAGGRRQPRPV